MNTTESPKCEIPNRCIKFGLMKRPLSLIIVAVLFILEGISAGWDIIAGLLSGLSNLDFGIVNLFVGVGLLRLRSGWRSCALALIWIGLLLLAFSLVFAVLDGEIHLRMFGHEVSGWPHPVIVALATCLPGAILGWMYWVLVRPDVKALFEKQAA